MRNFKLNPRLALLCAVMLIAGISQLSMATITGSKHDLKSASWNSEGEICIVCHTPHNADTTVSNSPLWNHGVTSATFTLYSSDTMDATVGQPGGASKLCLSCHDGTVALDSYGGKTGTSYISGSPLLGTDLSDDHPVSFTYDSTLSTTDGELFDPASTNSGLGGTIKADMLFSDKLECASCHDVHNTVSSGNSYLLLKSNSASALCLTCHDK